MSNTNCKNINSCNSCNSCDSCNYCNSCNSCNSCDSCNYCNYCYSCYSCNFSTGLRMSEKMIFCLGEGKYTTSGAGYQKNLQIFNKSVTNEVYNSTKSALNVKNFKLPIAKWVESKDMTKEEKSNYSSHKENGGFLKTLSYEDAWKEMWVGLSLEDKTFFTKLPNFDAEIFEKITGIKPELKMSLKGKTVKVELDGESYEAIIQ